MAELAEALFLIPALRDLASWLGDRKTPSIVIGGVATSILGRPRLTADIDVSAHVDEAHWADFLAQGENFGFVPRQTNALTFARQSRVLLLRHAATGISLDVVFAGMPFEEEAIARAQAITLVGITLPFPTIEDLVVMKAVAHRPRDLEDIIGIVEKHPELNRRRVLNWVRQFSAVLEMPAILKDVQAIFRRYQTRR